MPVWLQNSLSSQSVSTRRSASQLRYSSSCGVTEPLHRASEAFDLDTNGWLTALKFPLPPLAAACRQCVPLHIPRRAAATVVRCVTCTPRTARWRRVAPYLRLRLDHARRTPQQTAQTPTRRDSARRGRSRTGKGPRGTAPRGGAAGHSLPNLARGQQRAAEGGPQ
jgi:hypothetical protein